MKNLYIFRKRRRVCTIKSAWIFTFMWMSIFFAIGDTFAQSTKEYVAGKDTIVVYANVPGLAPSDKYTIKVRSVATSNEWVDVFAFYTYNRAFELPDIPQYDGSRPPATVVQHYQKFTSEWSHTYGNIEMSNNQRVEVEISARNGLKIGGKDFEKAAIHPAQKASAATLVGGKIYFTINKPTQIVIDINGQMDDYNAAINPIGHPIHAITLFANPVIRKPSLAGSRVRCIEPGTDSLTMRSIEPASYDTLYFKPGVHNAGRDFKIFPGKVNYLPGDAIFYGTMNNLGVAEGKYRSNGDNIRIYGYGTISGAKISHPNYLPPSTNSFKSIIIENGLDHAISGVSIVDPANHSVTTTGGKSGSLQWVKVISWRANGDGIGGYDDVEDCFLRTADDCSYIKGDKRRCTFWKDANAALFHMATIPEVDSDTTRPLILEDCDVLYNRLRTVDGTNGGGFQQRGEGVPGQRKVNVIIRNFRFHDKLINMPVFSLSSGDSAVPGSSYTGILFQNISIARTSVKQKIRGCAKAPWYGGIVFDNVTIAGTLLTKANFNSCFDTNEFVNGIEFGTSVQFTLLTASDPEKGVILSNPSLATYSDKTPVTLTAVAKAGYVFTGWSGDTLGLANPLHLVMNANTTISADFTKSDIYTFDMPGSYTWTVPADVKRVSIKVWGGGGAGGSAFSGIATTPTQVRGGGGAGGSFSTVTIDVTPGQAIQYTVGSGGIGLAEGYANLSFAPSGGSSFVRINNDTIVLALGGPGGQSIAVTNSLSSGKGGVAPKSGNTGYTIYYGGDGATANSNGTGAGGGSAGAQGNGGNGGNQSNPTICGSAGAGGGADGGIGVNTTYPGYAGGAPGGGGSGAAVRNYSSSDIAICKQGGTGGNGRIQVSVDGRLKVLKMSPKSGNSIEAFLNPATTRLFIHTDNKVAGTIELVDLLGRVVYFRSFIGPNNWFDLSGVGSGLHIVRINAKAGMGVFKCALTLIR